MDGSPLQELVILAVILAICAILYAFGAAVRCLNESEVEKNAEEGSGKDKKLLKYIQSPAKFIYTIQLMTGLMAGYAGVCLVGDYAEVVRRWIIGIGGGSVLSDVGMNLVAYLLVTVYLVLILLAIGIFVPKKVGIKYSITVTNLFVGFVDVVVRIFSVVTWLVTLFTNLILRVIGIEPNEEGVNVTEDEIINMVNEGHEQGVLEEREAEMISNIIELDEKTVGDVMNHRKNIVAIDGKMTLEEAVEFITEENYSRYPVFEENIDNVIGILHIKEVLTYYHKKKYNTVPIKNIEGLLRKPEFVPESRSLNDLFKEMQSTKNHMELVVDEYGQTEGLVAMEDILEEIVGNIFDEHDEVEYNIVKEAENCYLVKGLTSLSELEDELDIVFDEDQFDTINGYIVSKLDRIPLTGEKPEVEACGCVFQVLEVDKKVISMLKIIKKEAAKEENVAME